MYILQESLFSFEEWLEMDSFERNPIFFSSINLQTYAKKSRLASPQGAKGFSREAILRALLVAPLEGIDTFTALNRRLQSDLRFKYQCGFRMNEEAPSISTFSRVFDRIVSKGLFESLFNDLVLQCRQQGLIDGSHIAIDSTAIDAYEKKQPKSKCLDENTNWGAKYDTFKNKLTWFGYKINLAVDTKSELPVALNVTQASVYDGEEGPGLMKKVVLDQRFDVKYFIMDAGYDQLKNYNMAKQLGAQAITPLNLRNEKEPPEGLSSTGTPRCSMGYDMTYWGSDGKYLKFRCPHATGHVECPHGIAWCSSSNYGMVVKVNTNTDLRRFCSPHRDSKAWRDLYKERTSVERCNSRLKEHLITNDLHVRGIKKVICHAYRNVIVLLVSSLAHAKFQSLKKVA